MNMEGMFNKMFGQIEPGLCRMSMNGQIAIKTGPNEYKTYNVDTGRLTNCGNFAFNIGEEFFFVLPTNNVKVGDIILVHGEPRCVVSKGKGDITVINYKTSVKETIIPERFMFMGDSYFYGRVRSMFGSGTRSKGKKHMFKYMMMRQMLNGGGMNPPGLPGQNSGQGSNGNAMMQMWAMSQFFGGRDDDIFEDMFDGMFDSDDEGEDEPTPRRTRRSSGSKTTPKVKSDADSADSGEED